MQFALLRDYQYGKALSQKSSAPEVVKYTILVNHNYTHILSLSYLCSGTEKKILREIMHFHFMTYTSTRTTAPTE